MSEAAGPRVAIVVPVLNEERYIAACLTSLLQQGAAEPSADAPAIMVMDGGSIDGTIEIVRTFQAAHPRVVLIDNPRRLQSAAVNLAAELAPASVQVLLRADAHAVYPATFLDTCLRALRESGAASVVVPMRTVGIGGFQRAVAAAQNCRLGNGGSPHRTGGMSRFVEHGHHAAFDRAFFRSLGGYDETFTHNEDAEYDHRVGLADGRVWMCCDVAVTYYPRRDPVSLAKQYVRHGAGRARTLLTHQIRPRLRQLLPVFLLLGLLGVLALSSVSPVFLVVPAGYAALCLGWGGVAAMRRRDPWLICTGVAAMIMHLSWAKGFLATVLADRGRLPFLFPKRPGAVLAPATRDGVESR